MSVQLRRKEIVNALNIYRNQKEVIIDRLPDFFIDFNPDHTYRISFIKDLKRPYFGDTIDTHGLHLRPLAKIADAPLGKTSYVKKDKNSMLWDCKNRSIYETIIRDIFRDSGRKISIFNNYNTFKSLLPIALRTKFFTHVPGTPYYSYYIAGTIYVAPFDFFYFYKKKEQKLDRAKLGLPTIKGGRPVFETLRGYVEANKYDDYFLAHSKKRVRTKIKKGDLTTCTRAFYPGITKNEDTLKVLELGQYGKNYYIADVKNKKGVVFTVRLSHLKKYSKT